MAEPAPRQVDLMIDLRERMVRIETKLDLRADKDIEIDENLSDLQTRTTTLETEGTILRTQLSTLKWVGSGVLAFVLFVLEVLPKLLG